MFWQLTSLHTLTSERQRLNERDCKLKRLINLHSMLWVRKYPYLWLLPHNTSSLWGNAMKFYDSVNEGLIPVLTEIDVFRRINVRVSKQQTCIKPSVHHGCENTHTHTVELLRATCHGCGSTHALQRSKICPLHTLCHGCGGTHAFWRAGIESFPCVPALSLSFSSHFTTVIHWHRTQFLLLGGSVLSLDILSHLLLATNLRLFGFIWVDFYQFWKTRYMTLE